MKEPYNNMQPDANDNYFNPQAISNVPVSINFAEGDMNNGLQPDANGRINYAPPQGIQCNNDGMNDAELAAYNAANGGINNDHQPDAQENLTITNVALDIIKTCGYINLLSASIKLYYTPDSEHFTNTIYSIADSHFKITTVGYELYNGNYYEFATKTTIFAVPYIAYLNPTTGAIFAVGSAALSIYNTINNVNGLIDELSNQENQQKSKEAWDILNNKFDQIKDAYKYTTNTAIPAAKDFITNTAIPAIKEYSYHIANETINAYEYTTNTAIPAVKEYSYHIANETINAYEYITNNWEILADCTGEESECFPEYDF